MNCKPGARPAAPSTIGVCEPADTCDVAARRSGTAGRLRRVHNWTIRLDRLWPRPEPVFCVQIPGGGREPRGLGSTRCAAALENIASDGAGAEPARPADGQTKVHGELETSRPRHPRRRNGILQIAVPRSGRGVMQTHMSEPPGQKPPALVPSPCQKSPRRAERLSCVEHSPTPAGQVSISATGLASLASIAAFGEAGNCSTFARWPSHKRVSSTIWPPGNSSASWWTCG